MVHVLVDVVYGLMGSVSPFVMFILPEIIQLNELVASNTHQNASPL